MIAKKGITFLEQLFLRQIAALDLVVAQAGWPARFRPMEAQPASNRLRLV